ncbi:hypothetical protein GGU10DRAFT_133187 [Lentinula aff. detonsa]|uniref:Transcription elongation factor Eaf N-terminal domain-containing protein n=1 Tax=Lentinula aff. detonsa TaxID=2804958 RepID=A0AA38KKU7_9AGAR|nr:hypothetical protein GGU10DRAFT_133187 [Lentinula aff. detonsa]
MPSNSNNSWTPSAGRHQLNIGSSLGRALRARKNNVSGQQPAKRNILPEREFYSVRYGFKPSLIDSTKPGSLDVRRTNDDSNASVTVEHASTQPGEIYSFPGKAVASKEWTCILIYDEETGGYTLEKLESSIALGPPEKRAGSTRPSRSPSAQMNSPPISTPSSSTHQARASTVDTPPHTLVSNQSIPMELDHVEEAIPPNVQAQVTPTPPIQRPKKPLPQRSRAEEETLHSTSTSVPPPTQASTSTSGFIDSKSKKTAKRATPTFSDAEEETLEFGRLTKRNRVSPIPQEPKRGPSPSRLELPGMANAVVHPPPIPVPPKPKSSSGSRSQATAPLPLSLPLAAGSDSDSEDEEWDEVAAPSSITAGPVAAEDEGGEEIDINEFNTLMNAHLEVEEDEQEQDQDSVFPVDDFLAAAIAPEESPVLQRGPPISLKQFAGGDSADEDEYTSSEESDED